MTVTATSVTGKKLAGFRTMLSKSATLQSRLTVPDGTNAETIALQHIRTTAYVMQEPGEHDLPSIVLEASPEFGYRKIARGNGDVLFPFGAVQLMITDKAQHVANLADSETEFRNFAEGCLHDLAGIAGDNTNPDIVAIDTVQAPAHGSYGEQVPAWTATYRLRWGVA